MHDHATPGWRFLRVTVGWCGVLGAIALLLWAAKTPPVPVQPTTTPPETRTVLGVSAARPSLKSVRTGSGPVRVAIELTNREAQVVEIGTIRTSCGCTTAEPLDDKRLAPGAARTIYLSASRPKFGEQRVTVDIPLKRGKEEAVLPLAFQLAGEPSPTRHIYSMPREVEIRGVPGQTVEYRMFIDALEPRDVPPWISGWESNDPRVSAVTIQDRQGDQVGTAAKRHYEVMITAQLPNGRERESCRLMPVLTEGGETVRPIMIDLSPTVWRPYPSSVVLKSPLVIRIVPDDITLSQTPQVWRLESPATVQAELLRPAESGGDWQVQLHPVTDRPIRGPEHVRIMDATGLEVCRIEVAPPASADP